VHIFYLLQTRVINFIQKDISEMFPKWEFDAEDTPAENIIKLMFVKRPWKWTMDCWEVTGTWVNTKPAVVSPTKKKVVKEDSPRPRKKARKEAPAEASEETPAEASEEVHTDIVDAMREGFGTCLKEIKYLSERVKAVEKKSEMLMGRTREGRACRRIKLQMCRQMLVPRKIKLQNRAFNLLIRQTTRPKELADWLKTCSHYRTPLDKKTLFNVDYLPRYDANPQHIRSERMCFLDHLFAQQWRFNYKDFKDSELDQNGLERRLPVNYTDSHWIAMWISIPKRHIVIWDSICSIKKHFAKHNGKTMRDKIAVDIFKELPNAHEFENKDNDSNLGAYEGRLTVKSSGMLDDLTISSLESLLCSDLL
ncbi:unnamed protein product, partial [Brassica oleracea]